MVWDPGVYLRYADERALPFFHLLAGVRHPAPGLVVDLGCGPGGLTATLLERWQRARIIGVDSDPEMIGRARGRALPGRLEFVQGDVRGWRAESAPDVILSNACLHWVPDHLDVLVELAGSLTEGGVLAFQVPDNFAAPSHRAVAELRAEPHWRDRLEHVRGAAVEALEVYRETLEEAGLTVMGWHATYHHLLQGSDPVLAWLRGTTLRPILAALEPADGDAFCAELAPRLRDAYPAGPRGTIFPFRRLFVVATR